MKIIDVHDLVVGSAQWLALIAAGEVVAINEHGKPAAHLIPALSSEPIFDGAAETPVDWTTSAAFTRDRTGERVLTAEEVADILNHNKGKW